MAMPPGLKEARAKYRAAQKKFPNNPEMWPEKPHGKGMPKWLRRKLDRKREDKAKMARKADGTAIKAENNDTIPKARYDHDEDARFIIKAESPSDDEAEWSDDSDEGVRVKTEEQDGDDNDGGGADIKKEDGGFVSRAEPGADRV